MSNPDQINKLLGFANRARKLTFGMHATIAGIRKKKVYLVLVAGDLGKSSELKITREIPGNIPLLKFRSKEELSALFDRRDLGILGIADQSFARSIKNLEDVESNL